MRKTTETGRVGERAALGYLSSLGMTFLAANYRFNHYEIDLIMREGPYIVFVEVKTRSNTEYGLPREYVDKHKQFRLITAAQSFLSENRLTDSPVRFDVTEVYLETGKILHIRDAFRVN